MIQIETKIAAFEAEYRYIKTPRYVEDLKKLVGKLPDYFFDVAASSTGKYHPAFSLGEGGLLRHTKAAVRIAYEMYQDESITGIFKPEEKDLMLFALVLHDGLKSGKEKSEYHRIDHPLLAADFIREHKEELSLTENELEFVASAIATHMGPWTTDYKGNEVLQKPVNKYQKYVHMCDYIASRKFLDVKFNQNEIVE